MNKLEKLKRLYSEKQIDVLKTYFRVRPGKIINHGAIRSGKTMLDNDLFMAEIIRISKHVKEKGIKEAQYILAGASLGNIEKNVLSELRKKYSIDTKLDRFNRFKLFGIYICCVGHDDIGNISTITGMTAYGCYINEAHLANEAVFDEIMKRISGDANYYAIAIMDANPDAPNHWLKINYIDKADGRHIYQMHWSLHDNPFLNPDKVAEYERDTPSGMFYDRKILGLWVTAEGIVYRDYRPLNHVIDIDSLLKKESVKSYFGAIDWGYEHDGVFGLFGLTESGKYVLLKLIVKKHQLIDWWADQVVNVSKALGTNFIIYCDTARPDNISYFRKKGIAVMDAIKDVMPGIECVAKRLKNNTLLIEESCKKMFEKEIFQYKWDSLKGVPIKENDDVMDMTRYAVYTHDKRRGINAI